MLTPGAGERRFDPASMYEVDNWWVWEHHDLERMVHGIDSAELHATGRWWQTVAEVVNVKFADFRAELAAALGQDVWQGQAAETAAEVTHPYLEWGHALSEALAETGTRMLDAAEAVDATRANLPQAQDFDLGRMLRGAFPLGVLGMAADAYQQHQEQQHAKAEAVRVMNTYFTAGYRDVDARVPAFPDPPTVIDASPPDTAGVATSSAGAPGLGYAGHSSAPPAAPWLTGGIPEAAAPCAPAPAPGQACAPAAYPATSATTTTSSWSAPGALTGPGQAPDPAQPPRGTPAGPVLGSARAGGIPGGRNRGVPNSGGGRSAGAGPAPGRAAGPTGERLGARGPAGASAGVGSGGMGPAGAGARRQSEEDSEHATRFVVDENHDAEFGFGQPYVRPVIGEG